MYTTTIILCYYYIHTLSIYKYTFKFQLIYSIYLWYCTHIIMCILLLLDYTTTVILVYYYYTYTHSIYLPNHIQISAHTFNLSVMLSTYPTSWPIPSWPHHCQTFRGSTRSRAVTIGITRINRFTRTSTAPTNGCKWFTFFSFFVRR